MKSIKTIATTLLSLATLLAIACNGTAPVPDAPSTTATHRPATTISPTSTNLPTAPLPTSQHRPPPGQAHSRWSPDAVELAGFLRDVATFRTDPVFLNYCYSPGGPYADWAEQLREFADRADVQIIAETGLVPMDLWVIGYEYCLSQGQGTETSQLIVDRIELDWLEYALDPDPPQAARPTEQPPTVAPRPTQIPGPTSTPRPTNMPTPQPTPTNTPIPFQTEPMVTAASDTACGLHSNGQVECWYRYGDDELAKIEGTFQHIHASRDGGCGVTRDGTIDCWNQRHNAPDDTFLKVIADYSTACGLLQHDRTILCWNANGSRPAPRAAGFVDVSIGSTIACALHESSSVTCWGIATGEDHSPQGEFQHVSVGGSTRCLVHQDGQATCTGFLHTQQYQPQGEFSEIDVHDFHACGLQTDGQPLCWNAYDGTLHDDTPDETFIQIAAGSPLNCGLRSDGTALCWNHVEEVYEHGPPQQTVEFDLGPIQ